MSTSIVDTIADKFGGRKALSEAINADQTTIAHWKRRGIIPARQQQRILQAARALGVAITPADFFEAPAAPSAEPQGQAA